MRARPGYVLALGILFGADPVKAEELFEQEPGTVISIDANTLPQPYSPPSPANPPRTIPKPARALPTTLPGFSVNAFASGLKHARNLKVAPDGTAFLSEPRIGQITLLRDTDQDDRAEVWGRPTGIAMAADGSLLFADDVSQTVWRVTYEGEAP